MISVIIPIHNAERTLPVCLDSLLAQRFPDWEAVLVDDGSTDESLAVARRYSMMDRRFRCFHQDNTGVSAARNLGLRHATREWVYLLDADDSLFDNAFDLFFHHVSPEYDALVGGYVMVDESGRVTYSVNERAEISLSAANAPLLRAERKQVLQELLPQPVLNTLGRYVSYRNQPVNRNMSYLEESHPFLYKLLKKTISLVTRICRAGNGKNARP